MVMHPQEIEERKITQRENELWWQLDKIAVKYSNPVPESSREERLKKAEAAENMMRHLQKPTHEWCQEKYKSERN